MVPFGTFGARRGLGLLRQGRCRREPETDEERQGLDRDPNIALERPICRTNRSSLRANAASCRSAASGDRKEAIAASAISDFDLPR